MIKHYENLKDEVARKKHEDEDRSEHRNKGARGYGGLEPMEVKTVTFGNPTESQHMSQIDCRQHIDNETEAQEEEAEEKEDVYENDDQADEKEQRRDRCHEAECHNMDNEEHIMKTWKPHIKLKKAQITYKIPPRWRQGKCWPPPKAIIDTPQPDERASEDNELPMYSVRYVRGDRGCTRFTDTTTKQMWTGNGYRNICCIECKHQSRTKLWTCTCKVLWHECPVHKVDPLVHLARQAKPKPGKGHFKPGVLLSTSRATPGAVAANSNAALIRKRLCSARHTSNCFCNFLKTPRYGLTKALCPQLAATFSNNHPHLLVQDDDTATGAASINAGSSCPVRCRSATSPVQGLVRF